VVTILVEERQFDPARYTTCGLASPRTWRRRKDSTSILLPRWERWVSGLSWTLAIQRQFEEPTHVTVISREFRNRERCEALTRNEQPIKINAALSYPILSIVRAKIYSKNVRPGDARKHRVLLYTITIVSGRPSVARSRSRSPVHQPLTDPQPQYSLNLNFLPISLLRALTVALSEGFVFPSSRTSPLAFKA
jgi:hypothetical protein